MNQILKRVHMNSYPKDPYEEKYQFLINKRKGVGLKEYNNSKAFIKYSNYMNDIYENNEKNFEIRKAKY